MSIWSDSAPRIWRHPDSDFEGDEPLDAATVYTDEVMRAMAEHRFNGVWLRGRLYELVKTEVLPVLADGQAEQRLDSLRTVIARGRAAGVGVYLFLNEPLALPADHPLWSQHPELKGEPFFHPVLNETIHGFCTSNPLAHSFLKQATGNLLTALPGLAGVILITATENHSHCWAHTQRFPLDDGVEREVKPIPDCPRCRDREPGDIVLELLTHWRDAARDVAPDCRVLAWNWSWSLWYPDPQTQIVSRLPRGVELLVDFERGGVLEREDEQVRVDEYAMCYPGPSGRFEGTRDAAPAGTPIHAKLQLGTTHECATVPNLPLMDLLHAKLAGLEPHGVRGAMGCWNFGCSFTLNTYAFQQFAGDPEHSADADRFLDTLAGRYFGDIDVPAVRSAWSLFSKAFGDHYPLSTVFLYWSPMNDAPAHPLSLHYQAVPLGPSWTEHAFGDDPRRCLGNMSCARLASQLKQLADVWDRGLLPYRRALSETSSETLHATHRAQELGCAEMIGLQCRCAAAFFAFHARRLEITDNANEPQTLPADAVLLEIMREEIERSRAALTLCRQDRRLGLHEETKARLYSPELIEAKIDAMQAELDNAAPTHHTPDTGAQ